MEVSESACEHVVSQIFDILEYGVVNIPTGRVMELIAPYIGNNISEFSMLKEILDSYSINGCVNKNDLKSGLLQWTENLKSKKEETCLIQENSMSINFSNSENVQYSSFSSMSSQSYRERIADLQNDVAEREYVVCQLKSQLDVATNQTQVHEEALMGLTLERDKLRSKLLQMEQQNTESAAVLKREYEELMETFNSLTDKLKIMTNNLNNLKKQNGILSNNIAELDNEKHSLSMMLSKSNKDKNKTVCLLTAAESSIAMLKSECLHFKDRIQDQEKTISHLTSVNNSLEINLQNTSLLYKSHQQALHCDENSNEGSDHAIDRYDFRKVTFKIDELQILSDASEEKEAGSREPCVTSTPRNQLSLMQELNQTPTDCRTESALPGVGYDNFKFTLNRLNSAELAKHHPENCVETSMFKYDINKQSPTNVRNPCRLTYVLDENSLKERMDTYEIDHKNQINILEKELNSQRDMNTSILKKLNSNNDEMAEMKRTIDAFKTKMAEMGAHETLLGFNIWCMHRRLKALQFVSEERSRLFIPKIKDREMFLENSTQTECTPVIANSTRKNNTMKIICVNKSESSGCISTIRRYCSHVLQKVWFWGTIFCLAMACVRLYNTMKYCSTVRRGSIVRIFPWNWITIQELLLSIFDYDSYGQVPI